MACKMIHSRLIQQVGALQYNCKDNQNKKGLLNVRNITIYNQT